MIQKTRITSLWEKRAVHIKSPLIILFCVLGKLRTSTIKFSLDRSWCHCLEVTATTSHMVQWCKIIGTGRKVGIIFFSWHWIRDFGFQRQLSSRGKNLNKKRTTTRKAVQQEGKRKAEEEAAQKNQREEAEQKWKPKRQKESVPKMKLLRSS